MQCTQLLEVATESDLFGEIQRYGQHKLKLKTILIGKFLIMKVTCKSYLTSTGCKKMIDQIICESGGEI